jgi:hypothetical protein
LSRELVSVTLPRSGAIPARLSDHAKAGQRLRAESRALGQVLLDHHRQITSKYPPGEKLVIEHYLLPYNVLCTRAHASYLTRIVGSFLGEIADWCAAEGWPPLNSLSVNAETGMPGEGYDRAGSGLCNIVNWPREVEQCIRFKKYPTLVPRANVVGGSVRKGHAAICSPKKPGTPKVEGAIHMKKISKNSSNQRDKTRKLVDMANPEDDKVLDGIELVGKLIGKIGDRFAEYTEYLERYGDTVRLVRGQPGYRHDISGILYFCEEALRLTEASHMLLEKWSDKLKAITGEIARRPRTLPLPVGIDTLLKEKMHWPDAVESASVDGVEIYRARVRPSLKRKKK